MKRFLLAFALSCVSPVLLAASDSLELKLEPEQKLLLRNSPQEIVVKIDLAGTVPEKNSAKRSPLNVALVMDRSGSMAGAKLEQAKQAAYEFVDRLAPGDIFSLVAYSSQAQVLIPAQPIEDKEQIKKTILALRVDGGTALYAGVEQGAEQLLRNHSSTKINRVLLLSDGLANVGPSRPEDLSRLGSELARKGVSVTTIGVGDDYSEQVMSALAEASDANYYYVKDTEKLPEILGKEFGELASVAARDIEVRISCPNDVQPLEVIGRTGKFENGRALVKLSSVSAGQNRFLLVRCNIPKPSADSLPIVTADVRFRDERADGKQRLISKTLSLETSSDRAKVRDSVNTSIVVEKEFAITAAIKDQAIALGDKGNYAQVCNVLNAQADKLAYTCANAPEEIRVKAHIEIESLRAHARAASAGQYNKSNRKQLQSESWSVGNSKQR